MVNLLSMDEKKPLKGAGVYCDGAGDAEMQTPQIVMT